MYTWNNDKGEERTLYNNYVLIAPRPNSSALVAWRDRCRSYMENPATSIEELDSKPLLRRIRPWMTGKDIGMMGVQAPYLAMCWLLTDIAWHEPENPILELPFSNFGLGTPIIHDYTQQWKNNKNLPGKSKDFEPPPTPSSQPLSYILGMGWSMYSHAHVYDRSFATETVKQFTVLKFSIHFHNYNRVEHPSTIDHFQRAVGDTRLLPTQQATLDRSRLCSAIYNRDKSQGSSSMV